MIDTVIKLKNKIYSIDDVGNQVEDIIITEVPIIRLVPVYASEFYRASQAGFKPSIQLVISSLNYNNEDEATYNNEDYTIVRFENTNLDEVKLTMQVKVYEK